MNTLKAVTLVLSLGWALASAAEEPGAVAANAEPAAPKVKRAPAAESGNRTMDRLELGTTAITGNRELPKVMYVVPWKHAEIGDLGGKPLNSLVDEVLAPVDRDVFRREINYFDALEGGRKAEGEKSVTAGERAP
jgi:hypothetical protein